jgi:uncharacterized protein involved in exopolysaccharide biosynthesis
MIAQHEDDDSISLLDLLTILGKEKGLFLGIPVLAVLVAVVVSLLLTPLYTAKAVFVIPDKSTSASSALADQLGGAGLAGLSGLPKNQGAMYAAMMESNTVRMALAQHFHLKERYQKSAKDFGDDDMLKVMKQRIKINNDVKTGFISVEVEDEVPQFAAELANAHLEEMRKMLNRMSATDAEQRSQFFEQQIEALEHRPLRDPLVQTGLMTSLIRQYEAARMDQARNALVLHVVDLASVPERRSFPKRTLMVLLAGLGGLMLGTLLAFVRHAIRRSRSDPESQQAWVSLRRAWGSKK